MGVKNPPDSHAVVVAVVDGMKRPVSDVTDDDDDEDSDDNCRENDNNISSVSETHQVSSNSKKKRRRRKRKKKAQRGAAQERNEKCASVRCADALRAFDAVHGDECELLDARHQALWAREPHVRQRLVADVREGCESFFARDGTLLVAAAVQRTLRVGACDEPTRPYRRRRGETKSVEHWGQRKLFVAELEFLTAHAVPGDVVVYAGAAPGLHLAYLAALFPGVGFVLYDPDAIATPASARVRVCSGTPFTDAEAARWAPLAPRVLFVSDVRCRDDAAAAAVPAASVVISDAAVAADMAMQMRWVVAMRPRACMLKFRLPYTAGTTRYLDGTLVLPVWGGRTTSETRLVVRAPAAPDAPYPLRDYDHLWLSDAMFHHNTVRRVALHAHRVAPGRVPGLDHCYDCAAEVAAVTRYLAHPLWGNPACPDPDPEAVARMVVEIGMRIGITRTALCVF